MGQLHLAAGTRYLRDGRAYVVLQVLRDGRLLVEDQTVGGQAVATREDLTAAWAGGLLCFEVRGPGAGARGEAALPTAYTIADFHLLPEAARAEAWRRYTLIRPLLAWPPGVRTRRAIARHLADTRTPHGSDPSAGLGAASRTSVERYLRAFEASGGDIRALAPAMERGDAGRSGLDAEVEEMIQKVLTECRAAPTQRTVRDVYLMVVERVRVRNQGRPPAERMVLPSVSTAVAMLCAEGSRAPGHGEKGGLTPDQSVAAGAVGEPGEPVAAAGGGQPLPPRFRTNG